MTHSTRQTTVFTNAMATAICVNGHVRPGMGSDLNASDAIKGNDHGILRRVIIQT